MAILAGCGSTVRSNSSKVLVVAGNHRRPAADDRDRDGRTRLTGDKLTELYVRTAATAALVVAEVRRTMALFLGLAIGLDRSDVLRIYAVFGDLVRPAGNGGQR